MEKDEDEKDYFGLLEPYPVTGLRDIFTGGLGGDESGRVYIL